MSWKFYCDGEPNADFKCCHDCDCIRAYTRGVTMCGDDYVLKNCDQIYGDACKCEHWKPMEKFSSLSPKEQKRAKNNLYVVIRKPAIEPNREEVQS